MCGVLAKYTSSLDSLGAMIVGSSTSGRCDGKNSELGGKSWAA
ncbi:hypothetical protein [Helicobacter sp.]|nr:hypothetical protein [Helicobacter sp.]